MPNRIAVPRPGARLRIASVVLAGAWIAWSSSPARAARGDITLVGQLNPVGSDQYCQIWGFERDGHAYAVIGDWDSGPVIIDVTDPTNPFVRKKITGPGVFGFDVKVWGNYLYTCEGWFGHTGSSSRAIDITNMDLPIVSLAFNNAHAFSIHPDGYLFAEVQGLRCYDLNADPTPSAYLWWDGTSGGHDSTVDIEHNRLYDFHGNAGTYIWDITNVNSRVLLGSITDPNINYHHSGDATEDGNVLFLCDELALGVEHDCTVWSLANPSSPQKITGFTDLTSTIHNLYIVGNFAFVSHYTAGFRVYDVADPANPVLLDTYDTAPLLTGDGYDGCYGVYPWGPGGIVYASDSDNGLFVFTVEDFAGTPTGIGDRPSSPATARLLGSYPNPFNPSTAIAYEVDRVTDVTLAVYDIAGARVRVLESRRAQPGRSETRWDGTDAEGRHVASGVYFVRLTANGAVDTGRMVLLK